MTGPVCANLGCDTGITGSRPAAPSTVPVATVGIVGGAGFTGALLAELLLRHPSVELTHMSSRQLAGESVRQHLPRVRTSLAFCHDAEVSDVDVAFVCAPHGQAAPVVKRLCDRGARVVDLSADFRLTAAEYAEWYGEHACPELLPGVYGLTELHREEIASATLVANPGCYPTAALLALAPLKRRGLLDVVVHATSGVSGAGKTPTGTTHFCSVDSDYVAYGLATHRHYPEIAAGLAPQNAPVVPFAADQSATAGPQLTFVPHLAPFQRGISETIYVRVGTLPPPTQQQLLDLYREFYDGERFVEIGHEPPKLRDVVGTNFCRIYPHLDARTGRIVVISVLDNLMKGASGQAVQNMNVMLGLPEHEGLI